MPHKRITVPDILAAKGNRKLAVVTAYDHASARLADQAGMDVLLVGDSLAMVVLGHEDTLSVTMEEMLHHTRAVARGTQTALVVGDMPFLSYQASIEEAVRNAGRFLKEGRAQAVKIEGGREMAPQIRAMTDAGIPVMGHVGLRPQQVARMGGFKVQSKTAEQARGLLEDARIVAEAGCFAVVLEAIPARVATVVTEELPVPTIGIGAGGGCDGQVLVFHDILGLFDRFTPRFVKKYAEAGKMLTEALARYASEVREGAFPGPEHEFTISDEEFARFMD
ncbi:3-methyl-2-oxobutanoate hydroxymethyltransferase [Desulfolutivibrio sulfoxidireducens]|uniref:3-methyl-2-oxobutanoate hydroxymethyltransferase n=1 Tax=Desulfolutivibrio sulfoxidireducens TaxID=2773299 RepID=UPI00159D481D|nr:3-methyl-2-oxobutanoate hydroxymethyltransferase [Desulfolutivibrio sulfoxidireducens]QLA15663.1 3-methyl-2-oxobutanoate hydroxymethyltransferase [Desulfolutivibrio sulfoxidireducens]